MRSRIRWAFALVLSLLAVGWGNSSSAALMTGDIVRLGDLPGGDGGLFDVIKPSEPGYSFVTLCAHVFEDLDDDDDLDFTTNYRAVISDTTDPDNLPVGPLAGWLFTQFSNRSAELTNFNYNLITAAFNNNSVANDQARALQLGIWLGMGFTEQQIRFNTGWDDDYVEELMDNYVDAWIAKFNQSGWGPAGKNGGIKILRLYAQDFTGAYTISVQDQLYRVPEPSTLLLLGSVVCGGLVARRKWLRSA